MRRPIAAAAALALLAEAGAVVFVNVVLGAAVNQQNMSLAGLRPHAMSDGAWAAGALLGLYLLVCAVIEVTTAVRDRGPGRVNRLLLVVCAVVQGVLGAVVVGVVGWAAFTALMVVLALLVATLVTYPRGVSPATSP